MQLNDLPKDVLQAEIDFVRPMVEMGAEEVWNYWNRGTHDNPICEIYSKKMFCGECPIREDGGFCDRLGRRHNILDAAKEYLAQLETALAVVDFEPRKPVYHHLKCWPEFYSQVANGNKPFGLRKNDRCYRNGDFLVLKEWNQGSGFTGCEIVREITYILQNFPGIADGYVVMGLKEVTKES